MTIAETYASLARMLEYPEEKEQVSSSLAAVGAYMNERDLDGPCSSFARFLDDAPLAAVQEEYVSVFDFNPATAPYLGHHLFGDNQKKGGYMIMLKQEYSRHGFIPSGNELPDHLPVVLGFLAHLGREQDDGARKAFIEANVLPGVERLCAAFGERTDSPWKAAVEAARLLCAADCKEVHSC